MAEKIKISITIRFVGPERHRKVEEEWQELQEPRTRRLEWEDGPLSVHNALLLNRNCFDEIYSHSLSIFTFNYIIPTRRTAVLVHASKCPGRLL